MSVSVQLPAAAGSAPIAVQLSANLTEGRTVVMHVDPALLGNATPDRLELRYYDDHSDGSRTEVVFAKAASIADVLDPTNDGGRPEYWVVSDSDGLQVLVSVPHWSTHTVTLAGLGEILQPSVLMGLVAGLSGTLVAAAELRHRFGDPTAPRSVLAGSRPPNPTPRRGQNVNRDCSLRREPPGASSARPMPSLK
jgi:hypothetical protein